MNQFSLFLLGIVIYIAPLFCGRACIPVGVFPSMWTLHHPDGKQTTVRYIDESQKLTDAIKMAITVRQPEACHPVFVASSMGEAEAMADARHAELSGGAKL